RDDVEQEADGVAHWSVLQAANWLWHMVSRQILHTPSSAAPPHAIMQSFVQTEPHLHMLRVSYRVFEAGQSLSALPPLMEMGLQWAEVGRERLLPLPLLEAPPAPMPEPLPEALPPPAPDDWLEDGVVAEQPRAARPRSSAAVETTRTRRRWLVTADALLPWRR